MNHPNIVLHSLGCWISYQAPSPDRWRLRRISSPPPPSILSSDIFIADNTGLSRSMSFAQDVCITGWSCVGDAPPAGAGVKKSLQAAAHGSSSAYMVCPFSTFVLANFPFFGSSSIRLCYHHQRGQFYSLTTMYYQLVHKQRTTIHALKRYTSFVELDDTLRRSLPVCDHLLLSFPVYSDLFSDTSCLQFRRYPPKILLPVSALLSSIDVVDYCNIGWLVFYFIPKLAVSTS